MPPEVVGGAAAAVLVSVIALSSYSLFTAVMRADACRLALSTQVMARSANRRLARASALAEMPTTASASTHSNRIFKNSLTFDWNSISLTWMVSIFCCSSLA